MRTALLRAVAVVVGLAVAASAYLVSESGPAEPERCNVTSVAPAAPPGCFDVRATLSGRDAVSLCQVGGRCFEAGEARPGDVVWCHKRGDIVYLGEPWDSVGATVVLGVLSAACLVGAALCQDPPPRGRQTPELLNAV